MKYLSIFMSPRVLMTLRRSRPRGIVVSVRPLDVPRRHVAGGDARGPVRGEGRGRGRGGLRGREGGGGLPAVRGRAAPPDRVSGETTGGRGRSTSVRRLGRRCRGIPRRGVRCPGTRGR